jgi:hypothetical protein
LNEYMDLINYSLIYFNFAYLLCRPDDTMISVKE